MLYIQHKKPYLCFVNQEKKYPLIEKTKPQDCVASKAILSMRALMGIYKKHLGKHQITQSQLGIMMVLGHFRTIPQAQLGRIMMLDRSTVTRDLKRLVDRNYLIKEGAVNKLTLIITEAGLDFLESILPDWEEAKKEAESILGEDGMEALNLVLQKLGCMK